MNRDSSCAALTLRLRSQGESNREATFLTASEGILSAVVYGGPKSRLRSHVAPFNSGVLWIYRDGVKNYRKVSDFDVKAWRPGLRELYERGAAASAMAETILAFSGGGGFWEQALSLADSSLDALETANEESCLRYLVHFLWNWAGLLGLAPDTDRCASCACEESGEGVLWFIEGEGLLCKRCAALCGRGGLLVSTGARRWLEKTRGMNSSLLSRTTLDAVSLGEAKNLVFAILGGALGKRLLSWDLQQ